MLTRILAHGLRGRHVSVNAVAPGATAIELLFDRLAKLAPMERLGTPEEIVNVASFLVGPEAGWINAQTLRANGYT